MHTANVFLYAFLTAVALQVPRCASKPASMEVQVIETYDGGPTVAGSTADSQQNTIVEVSPGDTAVLQCPSNDERHRFQFWWMKSDQYIGPGTMLNSDKFKYEVLTGTLYIKVGVYMYNSGARRVGPSLCFEEIEIL